MEGFFGSKKPSPRPRTKTGFADLLHELGCLYEKLIELHREDHGLHRPTGDEMVDPEFEIRCSRRANTFKNASKKILTHDAPAELTEDNLVLYTDLVEINNSVIALMEEYIAKGKIGLLHNLRVLTGDKGSRAGTLWGVFNSVTSRMSAFDKELDLDEIDDAGEEYAGTEDEKDKDAMWFRELSKRWRLKLKCYYEQEIKCHLREQIFGTDSTPAPGSEKITAIMKRHDDFANELDEAEEMCASRRRVSLDLDDTLRVDLPCERDRNEAINEQDEIDKYKHQDVV